MVGYIQHQCQPKSLPSVHFWGPVDTEFHVRPPIAPWPHLRTILAFTLYWGQGVGDKVGTTVGWNPKGLPWICWGFHWESWGFGWNCYSGFKAFHNPTSNALGWHSLDKPATTRSCHICFQVNLTGLFFPVALIPLFFFSVQVPSPSHSFRCALEMGWFSLDLPPIS